MKKCAILALSFAACLWAADFWQSKPFTAWSDKDVQKMVSSSPWARQVSVSFGAGAPSGGRGRRGGGGGAASANGGMGEVSQGSGPVGGGGGGGGGGRGGGGNESGMGGGAPEVTVTLTWESARPIRQARMRLKFRDEAGTAPEAKNFLEREANVYVIALIGPMIRPFGDGAEEMKKAVIEQTSLTVKGKDAIKPDKLETGRGSALFIFPKTAPFSLDDKEAEFYTRVGPLIIKQKFHFKDMVVNGKLEL